MTKTAVQTAVRCNGIGFRYGERTALEGVSLEVPAGGVHAFLGPNGSGKSTLFKILATILPLQEGSAELLGLDLHRDRAALRRRIGVVFQSPALDRKLTVRENLIYAGHLFGVTGSTLAQRVREMLERTGLGDRARDRVETLSGGLQRRVELAKGMLHEPELLLLDEPSTGLDPGARQDLWRFLKEQDGLTVLFTTHLMDEASEADRVTILHEGGIVGQGTPAELVAEIGGEVLEIETRAPAELAGLLHSDMQLEAQHVDGGLRIQGAGVHGLVPPIMEAYGDRVLKLSLGHPTLEDVFIRKTGHRFWTEGEGNK